MDGFVTVLVNRFLFWYPSELPSHNSETIEWKGKGPTPVSCAYVLGNGSPLSVSGERAQSIRLGCLGTIWAKNSTACNPVPQLDTSSGYKRWLVETPHPPLLGVLTRIPS